MPERRVSVSPRRGRDAAATREAILEAATRRFANDGYQRAGVREIAADAGVTAALVNRYFGSKEKLFAEVIEARLRREAPAPGPAGRPGTPPRPGNGVRSGGCPGPGAYAVAAPAVFRHGAPCGQAVPAGPRPHRDPLLAEQIGGDDAAVRAAMVMAQLTGFAIMHLVHRPKAFAKARSEELAALLSKTLAACIGSDLAGAASTPYADDARTRHASSCS